MYIDSGLSLALALWSRSDVFLQMNDGKRALDDLQYAVKCGFPVKHRPEYYWRMAKCYAGKSFLC